MLGVNVTSYGPQSEDAVLAWLGDMGITFDAVIDDAEGSAYDAYTYEVPGAEGSITFLALVDGSMTVRALSWDLEETLAGTVEAVLAEG